MRRAPVLALLLALTLATVATPGAARAQGAAARFEIAAVGDSTFGFSLGSRKWVKVGQRGIVVDPRKDDELVARFRVLDVQRGQALALVTGQTTSLDAQHVVLLELPERPWWRQRSFWFGVLGGAVVGALAGAM